MRILFTEFGLLFRDTLFDAGLLFGLVLSVLHLLCAVFSAFTHGEISFLLLSKQYRKTPSLVKVS